MQRPIHARFTKDEDPLANRQPYIPSYPDGQPPSPVDQFQNVAASSYYYANQPAVAVAGAVRPSYLPAQPGSPDQPPLSKRRVSESSAASSRPPGHVRTMSERPRKVYDAPVTYGQAQTTAAQSSANRTKSKRRNSEAQRTSAQPLAKRESLVDYGAGTIMH